MSTTSTGNDWPLADAYVKMLQNPAVAFKNPELKKCTIKRDKNNQPAPMSGAFAVVFQATLPDGTKRAVRAFTSDRPAITGRYREISEHLEKNRHIQPLVSFGYEEKGVRAAVGGKARMYPLVTMEWVPGVTLYEWVHQRCVARDSTRLNQSLDKWRSLIDELAAARIAHGDLQHANILVDDQDRFMLVDYDCMCVPSLVGEPNLEIGVAPYQHPERNGETLLSMSLDNFSSIFIYVALRALAAEPNLWSDYVVTAKYDKLLLRVEDFADPSASELLGRMKRSPDSELKRLADQLFELYRGPFDDVPALAELLVDYDKIRSLLDQKQFDEAVRLLESAGDSSDLPADLEPRIQNAQQRIDCRRNLQAKVQAGDERGMQQLYNPALLDDYPAAQSDVAVAREAGRVIPLLDQLKQIRQRQQWRAFTHIWDTNRALLENRKSAQPFRADVDKWRPRNQACESVLQLARQPCCDPDQLQGVWDRLGGMGGHPELDARASAHISRLIARGSAWKDLQPALQQSGRGPSSEQIDRRLVSGWDASLFKGWQIAESERPNFVAAEKRLQAVAQVQGLIQQSRSPPTLQSERDIVRAAATLPAGYEIAQQDRVQTAQRRLQAADQVTEAVQRQDDVKLAECWKQLCSLQGQSLVAGAAQTRARQAEQRAAAWTSFRSALDQAAGSRDERTDTAVAQQWNENLFRGWGLAEQERPRVDEARRRLAMVSQLDQLLRQTASVTLAGEQNILRVAGQLPAGYQHRHQSRAEAAQERLQAAQRLQQLTRSAGEEEQILEAWQAVQRLQATGLADAACTNRAKLAEERVRLWTPLDNVLRQIDTMPGEQCEAELVRLWNESLLRGWPRAEAKRALLTQANQNQGTLGQLQQAASQALSLQGESVIDGLAKKLPQQYDFGLRNRVDLARQRIAALGRLAESIRQARSENTIMGAANEVVRLQVQSLADVQTQRRVALAQHRVPILQMLEGLSPSLPQDQYDQQILRIWRDDLLRDCPQAQAWLTHYQTACHRRGLMQRLNRAIAGRDEPTIGEIMSDPSMAGYPLPTDWVSLVDEVQRATQGAQQLLTALHNNQRSDFSQYFDVQTIRRCHYMFQRVQKRLVEWVQQDVLPPERLCLGPSRGRESVVRHGGSTYRIRWAWPERRFVEKCVVGISAQRLDGQCDPLTHPLVKHEMTIDRRTYDKKGCSLFWGGRGTGYVYVWALVDLGFCTLTSPPFELGRIRPAGGAGGAGRRRR